MVNIKKFKYCENLLTYSNANNNIRQYVNDDIEQVFPISAIFREYKMGTLARKALKMTSS